MKASVKLREDPAAPPLLRAKLPVTVLGLPFVAAASAGGPGDLALHLRTTLPAGPSLHLSLHRHQPFFLTLRSGLGLWGSPRHSPLLLSAHLPLGPAATAAPLSFSIQICASLGDFSLKRAAAATISGTPHPGPAIPKENGGGVPGALRWAEVPAARGDPAEEPTSGTAVTVRTTLPVARRAVVRLRWAVKLPRAAGRGVAVVGKGLPFLAVDKISVERLEEEEGNGGSEKGVVVTAVEEAERDAEALKGMLFWMRRVMEGLRREQGSIKESLEELRMVASASAGLERGGALAQGTRRRQSTVG